MGLNGLLRPNIIVCLYCLLCIDKIRPILAVEGNKLKNVSVCNVDATTRPIPASMHVDGRVQVYIVYTC